MTTTELSELAKKLFEAYSRNSGNPPDCHHDRNAAEQWMGQAMEECGLASAEPVAFVRPYDLRNLEAMRKEGLTLVSILVRLESEPGWTAGLFTHAKPAAKVEALRSALWQCFVLAGGDADGRTSADGLPDESLISRAVDVVRDLRECYDEALRDSAPTPASVPDGCLQGEVACGDCGGREFGVYNKSTATLFCHGCGQFTTLKPTAPEPTP